jgi:hypothetical protein
MPVYFTGSSTDTLLSPLLSFAVDVSAPPGGDTM